ncbi:hypothetical protein F8M41_015450 [Gigaspora margarita]|uniref:Uncharacterized protein n=1 Tax=Gigaspora margarita TaxID=4874 RepID=A0A8H3WWJ1_GIGMA|nr:hypothetical protein F8M41_015450 [Gigaspora margarita]
MVPELEEISRKLMDLSENENLVQVNSTNLFRILCLKSQFRIFNYQLTCNSNNDYEKFYLWITLWKLQPRSCGLKTLGIITF